MKKTVFYNFYKNPEDENVLYGDTKHQVLFCTPFIEQKRDIDCSSELYSIKAPFELLHADVADIHFVFKISSRSSLFYLLLIYSLLKFILVQ